MRSYIIIIIIITNIWVFKTIETDFGRAIYFAGFAKLKKVKTGVLQVADKRLKSLCSSLVQQRPEVDAGVPFYFQTCWRSQ